MGLFVRTVPQQMQTMRESIENEGAIEHEAEIDLVEHEVELDCDHKAYCSSKIENDESFESKSKGLITKRKVDMGDRLQINFYGKHSVQAGIDMDMHYLTSILSFQRQFLACVYSEQNEIFDGELLGNKVVVVDGMTEDNDDNVGASSKAKSGDSVARNEHVRGGVAIPVLNESQQRACDAFIADRGPKIHIVQG